LQAEQIQSNIGKQEQTQTNMNAQTQTQPNPTAQTITDPDYLEEEKKFIESLHEEVKTAIEILKQNSQIYLKELDQCYTYDFFSKLMGIFNLNNIGLEIINPLIDYLTSVDHLPAKFKPNALKQLVPILSNIPGEFLFLIVCFCICICFCLYLLYCFVFVFVLFFLLISYFLFFIYLFISFRSSTKDESK